MDKIESQYFYNTVKRRKGIDDEEKDMARIDLNSIRRIDKDRNIIQEKVDASYSVFEKEGCKYVQIDTYGKADRNNPEKASQVIQFDRNTALFLIELLKREFNI